MENKAKLISGMLTTFPDVFNTVLENSALIANNLRDEYLIHTNHLIEFFNKKFSGLEAFSQKVVNKGENPHRVVERILLSLNKKKVGAIDGGLGVGLMGSVSPFIMRGIVYSVIIGEKGPEREKFVPSRFLINCLKGGGGCRRVGEILQAYYRLF